MDCIDWKSDESVVRAAVPSVEWSRQGFEDWLSVRGETGWEFTRRNHPTVAALDAAHDRVVERWPLTRPVVRRNGRTELRTFDGKGGPYTKLLGSGANEAAAWLDADSRLTESQDDITDPAGTDGHAHAHGTIEHPVAPPRPAEAREWTQEDKFTALTELERRYKVLRASERSSGATAQLIYYAIATDVICELNALRASSAQIAEARKIIDDFVNERDSELDMMRCDYKVGTPECEAWHEGVYEMWRILGSLKRPALEWLRIAPASSAQPGAETKSYKVMQQTPTGEWMDAIGLCNEVAAREFYKRIWRHVPSITYRLVEITTVQRTLEQKVGGQ